MPITKIEEIRVLPETCFTGYSVKIQVKVVGEKPIVDKNIYLVTEKGEYIVTEKNEKIVVGVKE